MRVYRTTPLAERFWAKVDRTGDCWLWTAYIPKSGYPMIRVSSARKIQASHAAYELMVGPIPDGLDILHSCDTPACVRPDHLRPGTDKDNADDRRLRNGIAVGDRNGSRLYPERRPRGESNRRAKLTIVRVSEMRSLAGTLSYASLAKRFGVSKSQAYRVVQGESW